MCVCSIAACAVRGRVWSTAACAAPGHVCSTAACVPLDVSVLQQSVCPWTRGRVCGSSTAICTPGDIWPPPQPTAAFAALGPSLYKSPVLHLHARLQELCAAPERVCLQEPALHLCVSVYKSFVLHVDMSTRVYAAPVRVRLAEICAAPGRVCLQEPALQLCMSANKSTAHSVPVDVQ